MKASALDNNQGEDSDLFGPSTRGYSSGAPGYTKVRPTMISAKYRLKEERRKVLKISVNKLRKIEDPESSLRRSVLINNTMKRLQKEAREEKLQKHYPRCCSSRSSHELAAPLASASTPLSPPEANKENTSPFSSLSDNVFEHKIDVDDVDSKPTLTVTRLMVCHETMDELVEVTRENSRDKSDVKATTTAASNISSLRKRSFEEMEDCDVHDVLSQFYMPPTPRMLTSIDDVDDEDEDVNVVDIDIVPHGDTEHKRRRFNGTVLDVVGTVDPVREHQQEKFSRTSDDCVETEDTDEVEVVLGNTEDVERRILSCSGTDRSRTEEQDPCRRAHPSDMRHSYLRFEPSCSSSSTDKNVLHFSDNSSNSNTGVLLDATEHQYSCGHSSIFGDIQSVVYHTFITSLES